MWLKCASVDSARASMRPDFHHVYAEGGRNSVPAEQRVLAPVLQILHSIPGERLIWANVACELLHRVIR